jgi:hypothetical protein
MKTKTAVFCIVTLLSLKSARADEVLIFDAPPIQESQCAALKKNYVRALKLWDEIAERSVVLHERITALESAPDWLRPLLTLGIRSELDRINRRVEKLRAFETSDTLRKDFLQELHWEPHPEERSSVWSRGWKVLSRSGKLETIALVNGTWAWGEAASVLEAAGFENVAQALEEFQSLGVLRLRRPASLVEICLSKVAFQANATFTVKGTNETGELSQVHRIQLRQKVDLRRR